MAYFTKEQISKAKEIDLLSYLKSTNPDELQYDNKDTFKTKTHDSLKISNGMWYWFSRGIGGKTALEYLIQVENYSFTEAVSHLINEKGIEKVKVKLTEKEKIDRLILPEKSKSNYKAMAYLVARGISKSIVDECIDKGYIYQESQNNNVVFVGFDENDNPRYAGIRGTNATRYMHDASGSDKTYSFKLPSIIETNIVHLFESAIDLLSYATLKELKNEKWYEENLLSLAGIYQPSKDNISSKTPKTLSHFLQNNSNIQTIYLHFDNDLAGRNATKAIQHSLSDSYKIIDEPPKYGKDFNDYLIKIRKDFKKKDFENSR